MKHLGEGETSPLFVPNTRGTYGSLVPTLFHGRRRHLCRRLLLGARMIRAARNIFGFVLGWLFILALAFGMEAAHALEFRTSYASSVTFVGSSGSSLCSQLQSHMNQTNAPRTWTVAESATLTRNSVTGSCRLTEAQQCSTDYTGQQYCSGGGTASYFSYYESRCSASDPWIQITPSAPACPVVQCPTTSETDAPVATGVMVNNSGSATMCQSDCQISPFSTDDGSSITTEPVGGQPATIRGSASTRWKVVGVCQTDPNSALQAELNAEKCQSVNGETVCVGGSTPKNCIKVNGGLSCTSDAGGVCTTPECTAMANAVKNADGSATAKQTEPTPSAPNTGTAGQRATPDLSYSQTRQDGLGGAGSVSGFDWFSQGTVAGSYNGDGSIGDQATEDEAPCDPATQECPGEPCDPATETCPGEEPPDEPGECEQDDTCKGSTPELGKVRTFSESLAHVEKKFSESDLATEILKFSIPENRVCPTFTIPFNYRFFSTSPQMTFHCTLGEQLRPQIQAMFAVFWIIVALFLFLRP